VLKLNTIVVVVYRVKNKDGVETNLVDISI